MISGRVPTMIRSLSFPLFLNDAISLFCYYFGIRVGVVGIEYLVAVHYGDEVFCVRKINDVMGPPREHMYALNVVSAYFKFNNLAGVEIAFLNKTTTRDNDKNSHLVLCQCCPLVVPGLLMLMLICP